MSGGRSGLWPAVWSSGLAEIYLNPLQSYAFGIMRLPVAILATVMLLAGSLNTIATKIQDSVVVGHDAFGRPLQFRHPAVQTSIMFAGEALCLIPFLIRRSWTSSQQYTSSRASSRSRSKPPPATLRRALLAFSIPALCDSLATSLLNLGLFFTYASVFQMLRGTLVIFAGLLTICLLRRRLHAHHWLGMAFITAGAALVGAGSIVYEEQDAAKAGHSSRSLAPNPLLGNLLVVAAQALNALQFILEEKFIRSLHPPVLLAVGAEGAAGIALSIVVLPFLAFVHGPDGRPIDDAATAAREIVASRTLQWSTVATLLSIALFNFAGVSVTKRLSGGSRAAIDACRTAFVWVFCLVAGWERFHLIQLVGFAVLLTGSSIYNDILRSCLPDVLPNRQSFDDVVTETEPLLPSDADSVSSESDDEIGGSSSSRSAVTVGPLQRESPERRNGMQRSQPMAARVTAPSMTMARTVTLLPGMFSPHSLASAPRQWMGSTQSFGELRGDVESTDEDYDDVEGGREDNERPPNGRR